MFRSVWALCACASLSHCEVITAGTLPGIFGRAGSVSAVPSNTARYILDLEAQDVYLHYYGDGQVFQLVLSPKLKEHLTRVVSLSDNASMPVTIGVNKLSNKGECDWNQVLGWTSPNYGADAKTVFYGREIRQAPNTLYGNAIQLSLGPDVDPEGWTNEEMTENFKFWEAIHHKGQDVYAADSLRQFRSSVASEVGGTFEARWGSSVTTKAHRFALQMYSAESQSEQNNPGGRFFEMFPNDLPPTTQVVYFEAEDGCKGTPSPKEKVSLLMSFLGPRTSW